MGFECRKNCGFCCRCVPISVEILNKNQHKRQRDIYHLVQIPTGELLPYTEDMYCIFLNKNNECVIYEDRPQLCKDFGCKKIKVECPFITVNGTIRRQSKVKQLTRQFEQSVDKMKRERDTFIGGNKK